MKKFSVKVQTSVVYTTTFEVDAEDDVSATAEGLQQAKELEFSAWDSEHQTPHKLIETKELLEALPKPIWSPAKGYLRDALGKPTSQCENCRQVWLDEDLVEVKNLEQRVSTGEPVPSGECPDCGCLCHPEKH